MRKLAIAIGIIVASLVIAKSTGMLVNYQIPTTSNEPTIHVNSHLFASSLVKPEVGDFVVFLPPLPNVSESDLHIYVKRLCGLGGDIIEMKNGVFFLNGENFDSVLTLQHSFIVKTKEFISINRKYPITDFVQSEDLYQIQTSDEIAKEFGILDKKSIQNLPADGMQIFPSYNQEGTWTRDNFGPLTVPEGMSFFMGDNRHYSYDSRFFGFVSTENIKGTVLGY